MATINGLYVFVKDENLEQGVKSATHPVEAGLALTDHVRREPFSLNLAGEIVGPNAAGVRAQLVALMYAGALVTYSGRNYSGNMQIQSFKSEHPYTIKGGMSFTMALKEVRIAQSSYKGTKKSGTQQIEEKSSGEKVYHSVKPGETAWYLGETVYKSKGSSVGFITANNPDAPRKKGDWTTLSAGARLHVYNKEGAG